MNAPLDFELQRLEQDHPYLRERGFTEETIKTFGLGYCQRGLMKGRIAIPLHDAKGALIGYAGRIVDEDAIGENTPRYLFPGSTGVWWLTQAGITNVVAVMGASCSEMQAALLRDLVPEDGSIWVFPDGDKAGERLAEEALVMLAPHRFMRWVKLPEGQQSTDLPAEELRGRLHVS